MICRHHLNKLKGRHSGVTTAMSLGEAREQLTSHEVGLILLDLTLPDSTLEETLDAIGELSQEHRAPIVALSSLATDEVAARALEGGATVFLPKQEMSADSLSAIFDQLDAAAPPAAPAPSRGKEPSTKPEPEPKGPMDPKGPSPQRIADAKSLASKITHDALGWSANIGFRTSALARDPAVQASEKLARDVASIRESNEALTSFISGARSLFMTQIALGDLEGDYETTTLELAEWLERSITRWKRITREKRLEVSFSSTASISIPADSGERLLTQSLNALLRNVVQHAARESGNIEVQLNETSRDATHVFLELKDNGGPWNVENPAVLGTPLGTGVRESSTAGLGLFTMRRALEAMGGELHIRERADEPGAYAVTLALRLS